MLAYLIGDLGPGSTFFLVAAMASVSIPVCIKLSLKRPEDYELDKQRLTNELKVQLTKMEQNLITSHREI